MTENLITTDPGSQSHPSQFHLTCERQWDVQKPLSQAQQWTSISMLSILSGTGTITFLPSRQFCFASVCNSRTIQVNLWPLIITEHCVFFLSGPGEEQILEITKNVTGVLGEDVYLSCSYLGESEIISAQWKRQIIANSKVKARRLVGFLAENKTFCYDESFSYPDSLTNLTVKMRVSSVEAEGEYICEFSSNEEDVSDSVILTVVGKPEWIMHLFSFFPPFTSVLKNQPDEI